MTIPVTVCVPLSPQRKTLFHLLGYPSIRRNRPAEVIIDIEPGTANVKRNRAAAKATQEYLFFCDDDVLLERYTLKRMHEALVANPVAAYAYSDFMEHNHPTRSDALYRPGVFDARRLRQRNYISTMSMVRRDAFEAVGGFDEAILRLQDWDLWLALLAAGHTGMYLPQVLFTALYIDKGITTGHEGEAEAIALIKRKHGLV